MSARNDKYRNPPVPPGYVKNNPQIVMKKKRDVDDLDIDELIDLIILSGICDVPDASVYDHFTINSCSEDDDIVEVPVQICPKKIEVLQIEDEDEDVSPDSKEDIKKEVDSPEIHAVTETSEDGSKASSSPKHKANLKTDLCTAKSDKIVEDKKPKKHDRGHKSSYHSKKITEKKDSCSNYDTDSSSYSKTKHVKKDYKSSSDSHSRRQHKRRESYESDSDSHSRGRQKRYDTDSESCRRKKLPKRYSGKDYGSDDNSPCKKSKREYSSDSSGSSIVRTIRKKRGYSSKEYYSEDEKTVTSIKQEPQPGLPFGQHICEICNITVNSFSSYQSHINGKRHMKNLNSQTAVFKLLPVLEENSRCPRPPAGYYREEMDCPAYIQQILDQSLKLPCPGLENVTEIRTVGETVYYCSFCNSPCGNSSILPHLNGFKHQINCLKHYNRDLYEKWSFVPKHSIQNSLMRVLKSIELESGRGQVKVEKDLRVADSYKNEFKASSRTNPSKPSTSAQAAVADSYKNEFKASSRTNPKPSTSAQATEMDYADSYINYNEPDPSKPGFYCRLCDSHSNSEGMWQNHILGKRHLANRRKTPGSAPSKSKYIPAAPNVTSHLFSLLDRDNPYNAPVVGLNQIREIRKPDIDGISYNCFLCNACISSFEIVGHILSRKHREKFLGSIKDQKFQTLRSCYMSDSFKDSIVEEICEEVQKKYGSGQPEVYYAKNAVLRK